jgi:hypothetical protein
MTNFSFLSPLLPVQPLQNITPKSSPPKPTSNLLPLITLDDYSVDHTLQSLSTQDYSEPLAPVETPSTGTLFIHHHDYPISSNSDSDTFYPPSSAVPSEASSAVVSESDLPSAVASESDLPLRPQLRQSVSKTQTGIHAFFQVLSEDEIQAARAKRKRANSEEEEADRTGRRWREEKQRDRKLAVRWDQNRVAQQKHRKKAVVVDIQTGVRDSDGKLTQVSQFFDCILCDSDLIIA